MIDLRDRSISLALGSVSPRSEFAAELLGRLETGSPRLSLVGDADQGRPRWVVLGVAGALSAVGAGLLAVHHRRSRAAA